MKHILKTIKTIGFTLLSLIVLVVLFFSIGNTIWNQTHNNLAEILPPTEQELINLGINTIKVNGLRFAYSSAGDPANPLILLIHGFPDGAHTYQEILPILADEGYYAVAYFQRGYYPTDIPENGDYTVHTLAQDALALIDAFGKDSAVIVGHDWGASTAYAAANINPQKVSQLVTIAIPHSSVVGFDTLQRAPHFVELQFGFLSQWYASRNNYEYIDDLLEYWSPNWDIPTVYIEQVRKDFSRPGRLQAAIGYYTSFLNDFSNKDHLAVYNQPITVPTLAFAGEEDGPLDIKLFEHMEVAFVNDYQFVQVPVAGHFVHQEAPEIFIEELLNFLDNSKDQMD